MLRVTNKLGLEDLLVVYVQHYKTETNSTSLVLLNQCPLPLLTNPQCIVFGAFPAHLSALFIYSEHIGSTLQQWSIEYIYNVQEVHKSAAMASFGGVVSHFS